MVWFNPELRLMEKTCITDATHYAEDADDLLYDIPRVSTAHSSPCEPNPAQQNALDEGGRFG